MFGPKKIGSPKNFRSKRNFVSEKNFVLKKHFGSENNLGLKNFWVSISLKSLSFSITKFCVRKKCWVWKKSWVPKNFWIPKKFWVKKIFRCREIILEAKNLSKGLWWFKVNLVLSCGIGQVKQILMSASACSIHRLFVMLLELKLAGDV